MRVPTIHMVVKDEDNIAACGLRKGLSMVLKDFKKEMKDEFSLYPLCEKCKVAAKKLPMPKKSTPTTHE